MTPSKKLNSIKHHLCEASGTHLCALDGNKCHGGCELAEHNGPEPFSSASLNEQELGALQAMCEMASAGRIQLNTLQSRHVATQTLKLISLLKEKNA